MDTVKAHYDKVLADIYAWMQGGVEGGIQRYRRFFQKHKIHPVGSGVAVDLGAGCGFQSIPLARRGFSVTAVDINDKLLHQLVKNAGGLPIRIVQDDLINFDTHIKTNAELIVCMTDTLIHLESKEKARSLFPKVFAALGGKGRFIITFRDLSSEMSDLDRFIPVKSDSDMIFTCFLEYEPETVKVHDIIYKKVGREWRLSKGLYRKLRLSEAWVEDQLTKVGFTKVATMLENGFVTVIATK